MDTSEKIAMANQILGNIGIKRMKTNDGLLEHTQSSMTILTNDNRELLMG